MMKFLLFRNAKKELKARSCTTLVYILHVFGKNQMETLTVMQATAIVAA